MRRNGQFGFGRPITNTTQNQNDNGRHICTQRKRCYWNWLRATWLPLWARVCPSIGPGWPGRSPPEPSWRVCDALERMGTLSHNSQEPHRTRRATNLTTNGRFNRITYDLNSYTCWMIYYESKHMKRNYTYTKQIPERTQRTPNELNGLSVLFSLLLITLYSLSLSQALPGATRPFSTAGSESLRSKLVFDVFEWVVRNFWHFRRLGVTHLLNVWILILSTFLSESSGKNGEKRPFWPNLTRRDSFYKTRRHSGDMTGRWWAEWIWTSSVQDPYRLTSPFDHIALTEWSTSEPRWLNTDVSSLVLIQRGHIRSMRVLVLVVELL